MVRFPLPAQRRTGALGLRRLRRVPAHHAARNPHEDLCCRFATGRSAPSSWPRRSRSPRRPAPSRRRGRHRRGSPASSPTARPLMTPAARVGRRASVLAAASLSVAWRRGARRPPPRSPAPPATTAEPPATSRSQRCAARGARWPLHGRHQRVRHRLRGPLRAAADRRLVRLLLGKPEPASDRHLARGLAAHHRPADHQRPGPRDAGAR